MKFASVLALGCALAAAAPGARAEIHIGVSAALTGPAASLGVPVRNALSLWPQEIGGEKVVLHVLDDAGDPTAATKNARRFVEDKMDAIMGSANTPSTVAIAQVANEAKIPQLSPSPAELPEGRDVWTFRSVMHAAFFTEGLVDHLKRGNVKSIGFLGLSDAYGEVYLTALNKQAPAAGLKVVAVERFTRADTSVAAQALKVVAAAPDAVLVVAVGGGAALPQKALAERGYKGKIYHTSASISPDFLRLAGKDANNALVVSGPEQLPEQMPASNPGREVALRFYQQYEAKFGAGTVTQFAANVYDLGLVLQQAVPAALKKAKPGTPEFRAALRDAIENSGSVIVTKGALQYSPSNHWGHGPEARVMLVVQDGQWKLAR
ncbi:MAG TPA: ABC transporter substrate-binding protein [Ideonella sp.]|nr:ABC transporter substrate-binding protein [Ideonella sp.]